MENSFATLWQPILIAGLTALLTGALPAYLAARQAKARTLAEAKTFDAAAVKTIAEAATQLLQEQRQQEQSKLETLLQQQELRIDEIERKHELERSELEQELLATNKQLSSLINYVKKVVDAYTKLAAQLAKMGIAPDTELPKLPPGLKLD